MWRAVGCAAADRHPRRRRQVGVGQVGRETDAFDNAHRPRRACAVAEKDADHLAVDEFAHATDRRLEDLAEVEGRRRRLGDSVKGRQEGVGLREPADAIEGQRVPYLGFTEQTAGDKDELRRPLRRVLEPNAAALGRGGHHVVRDGEGQRARHGQPQGEAEASGEAGGHDRTDDGEDER